MSRTRLSTVALLAASLVGLSACLADDVEDPETGASSAALSLSATDAALVLGLVNYPGTDAAVLDGAAGLDARAAAGIVAHRNGLDGRTPTADDDLFGDIGELDAIAYVGDTAFGRLQVHAAAHPAPAAESVEGALFQGWESEAVVWGVNHASESELDVELGLDARAARNLVALAPWASITAIGAAPYVGPTALALLHDRAQGWWTWMHDAGAAPVSVPTYDGVAFDEVAAARALAIANGASHEELTSHGVYAAGATAILAARPFASLAAVAAVSGVGPATMHALHDYAASGEWVPPVPPAPASTGGDYVLDEAHLAELTMRVKEGLWEDEGFSRDVADLAGWDEALFGRIMHALEAETDRLAAPLLGTSWPNEDDARDAIGQAAGEVKPRTRSEGWTYLSSLGVTR